MQVVRSIFGNVLGIALGLGVVVAGDTLNLLLFPPTAAEKFLSDVRALPFSKLLALPFVYALAAFAAAWTATKIAARMWAGWIAGGVLMAATYANLVLVAHPTWFTIVCIVLAPLAVWFGVKLSAPPRVQSLTQ